MRFCFASPEYKCPTHLAVAKGAELKRNHPVFQRVTARSDLLQRTAGIEFRPWDDTLRATVDSLRIVGGIKKSSL